MSVGTDIPGPSSSHQRWILFVWAREHYRVLPWMFALSPDDRKTCERDLAEPARTGKPHLAAAELTSWKETAAAIAAGLGNIDFAWLDEYEAVERP